ncbi:nuclear transport factor 2 family protein [Kitasatospora sp. NPDC093558]|uniref:nuclear transport factor 2 family protein n=1 Tax=Kitasatospora sp. NPDC093558 TaxID=3155201 RepID=UPI00343A978A
MADDAATVADAYFTSWRTRDFAALRPLLADEVHYAGPLAEHGSADAVAGALEAVADIMVDLVVRKVFVSGDDVLTWFDLHTSVADPTPVANWMRVEHGQITSLRAVYDPRGLTGA